MRRTVRFSLRTSVSCVLPLTGSSLSVTQKMRLLALGDLQERTQRMSAGYTSALEKLRRNVLLAESCVRVGKDTADDGVFRPRLEQFLEVLGILFGAYQRGVWSVGCTSCDKGSHWREATHAAGGCACL